MSIIFPLYVFAENIQPLGYYNKEKVEEYKDDMINEINNSSPKSKWNKETGFLQIDCTSEDYIVDAYSFGGKHTASILNENLQDNSLKNEKNIYLGGYTYLKEKKSLFRSSSNAQYISMTDNKVLDTTKANLKNSYSNYVASKNNKVSSRSLSTYSTTGTITKWVSEFSYQIWLTYRNTPNSSYGCVGYRYMYTVDTLIILDCVSDHCIYKSFSAFNQTKYNYDSFYCGY